MPSLLRPRVWTSQPQIALPTDKGNPLGMGVGNYWTGAIPRGVQQRGGAPNLEAGSVIRSIGGQLAIANTGSAVGGDFSIPALQYPFMLFGYGYFLNSSNNWILSPNFSPAGAGTTVFLRLDSATQVGMVLRFAFGTSRALALTLSGVNTGIPICMIGQVFSETDYRFYCNGLQANGTLSPGTLGSSVNAHKPIGYQITGGIWANGYGQGRMLPDSVALEITKNPALLWQMLCPLVS